LQIILSKKFYSYFTGYKLKLIVKLALRTSNIYDTLNIIGRDPLGGETCITKAFDVMTSNVVAARQSTTAREIGARLLLGDFNGLPVIDSNAKVIGIVTAVDILRAIRQGKNLDSVRAIDIMTRNPVVVKQDTEVNEIIDIILQKAIILVSRRRGAQANRTRKST
jgi:CBS domain-containing protein